MKRFTFLMITIIALMFCNCMAHAQAQTTVNSAKFAFAGAGYFSQSSPQIQAFAGMAIPITSDNKTISYTDFDISLVKSSLAQVTVAGKGLKYAIRTGLGYRIYQKGTWALYGLGAPGVASDGNKTSSSFEYGGLIGKSFNANVGMILGLTAENNGGVTDFAPRFGLVFKF